MALTAKDLYLVFYNSSLCLGWLLLLVRSIPHLLSSPSLGEGLSSLYDSAEGVATILKIVQGAAILEIIHAAVGLVRSPVVITTLQVGSRIAALFAIVNSPLAQAQFGAGQMILSWTLVEVPRYAFYVAAIITGDATKKTPYPLFYLRYSLFAVLYPTGIVGELSVFFAAARDDAFLSFLGDSEGMKAIMYYYIMAFPVIYAPGALPMILNMAGNRKKAFKKRFARDPPPPRGLVWPIDAKRGDRSSTSTAKAVLAAAVGAVDPAKAEKILKERNWRFGYVKHFVGMVEEQMKGEEQALKVARAGLDKAYEIFEFVDEGGDAVSFKAAMAQSGGGWKKEEFHTGFVKGTGVPAKKVLEVPYKGKILTGQPLKDQVDLWVQAGTIEPSAGSAIKNCVDRPDYVDLSDRYFVLLGAGSAMGPFLILMALGANIIAVDLDRKGIWDRLLKIARESSGTITFPIPAEQSTYKDDAALAEDAGCNLFTDTPKIRNWLMNLYTKEEKHITVGSYAYLDGALHVQVSLAMDAICKDLSEARRADLAYLCTPTDLHVVPKEAHDAALAQYAIYRKKIYCAVLTFFGRGKYLKKNAPAPMPSADGKQSFYVVNGISVAQGPNYALAKRLQHWRAIVARHQGSIVSSNIAPATSTVSVVHNRMFAMAYEGMPYFKPYEIFEPKTSNAVMSGILFSDLNDKDGVAYPGSVGAKENPNELFKWGAFHGGTWRCAYAVDSIGEASVLVYFGKVVKPYLAVVGVVGVAVGAKVFGLF